MDFVIVGAAETPGLRWFRQGLWQALRAHGHTFLEEPTPTVRLVLNFTRSERPRPFRRKSQGTFVTSIVELPEAPADFLKTCYPILVRALSNLLIALVPGGRYSSVNGARWEAHFITLELGHYVEACGEDEADFFERIYRRLAPLAQARLVINNEFHPDLPPELWNGNERTEKLKEAGRFLASLNLLPAPFPLEEILPPRDFQHVKRLYGLGGLSYGNLSVREDAQRFWMSASGVDKGNLQVIGRDILLVKGYDAARNVILLSVPPHIEPRRVSVDAIEHWMIYREHPEVGAIIHVHAWMEGIPVTTVNYPCGTWELAAEVAELVRQAPDPARAVIGLRNHGITVTGRSLEDIMERLRGRVIPQVPME